MESTSKLWQGFPKGEVLREVCESKADDTQGNSFKTVFSQISHNCYKGAEAANDAAGVRCYAHGHIIALYFHHTTLPMPFMFPFSDYHSDVGALVFIR